MRLLRSRPSGVELGAIGSASALPSTVIREGSPRAAPMIVLAACARAVDSWKFDGKAMVRIGSVVGIADDLHRADLLLQGEPDAFEQRLEARRQRGAARREHVAADDAHQRLRRRAEHLDELLIDLRLQELAQLVERRRLGRRRCYGDHGRGLDDRRAGDRRHAIRRRALQAGVDGVGFRVEADREPEEERADDAQPGRGGDPERHDEARRPVGRVYALGMRARARVPPASSGGR